MKIIYEKYRREYTAVGISAVFQSFFQKPFMEMYGGTFDEIVCLIKDGIFYHYQVLGDREKVSRLFLRQVNDDKINLQKEFKTFDKKVKEYDVLISKDVSEFSLKMINDFYRYYQELILIAYVGADSLDFIDALDSEKQEDYRKWITKVRLRAEVVYKNGELKFIPKYLNWLSDQYLPKYSPEQLKYLVFTELENYVNKKVALPSPEELDKRKKLFYLRQYPEDKIEFVSGDEVNNIIKEKGLLGKTTDQLDNIKEFSGQIAYKGKIKGRVRIIRSSSDMKDFKEGEIIVSPMTQPNYLPIMKQSIAFVTNEGGTLCHAAIVARELKKPCIIGTKIATHVLKDGDMVEVDAENGVVRIVE